jgi:hypothetical protein
MSKPPRKRAKANEEDNDDPAVAARAAQNAKSRLRRATRGCVASSMAHGYTDTLTISGISYDDTGQRTASTSAPVLTEPPVLFVPTALDLRSDWDLETAATEAISYSGVPLVTDAPSHVVTSKSETVSFDSSPWQYHPEFVRIEHTTRSLAGHSRQGWSGTPQAGLSRQNLCPYEDLLDL